MYFLSTGDEDHGRQRIGRCTGGSADPFLGTERGTVRQPNYGASEERATLRRWFLHCLSSIVSAEPAPLMDRVSPKLDASADGPEVINKAALRLPSKRGSAWWRQTKRRKRASCVGRELNGAKDRGTVVASSAVPGDQSIGARVGRAGWPPSRSGRPYPKAMHQGDPDSDLSQGQRHEKLHGSGTAEGSLSRHVRSVESERYRASSEPTVRVVPDVTVGKWLTALIKRVLLGRRLSRWSHSSASWWRPPGRARLCSRP